MRVVLIFLVAFFFSSGVVLAKPYFEKNPIPPTLLNPPFAVGSIGWQRDIDEIIELQKNSDPKEIEQAWMENRLSPESLVQRVDPTLLRGKYPELYQLLDRVIDTSDVSVGEIKNYWNKKRPYLTSKKVKALLDNPYSKKSYPSGHSAESYLMHYVLGLLIPQYREAFQKRAEQIARHRVLVGMHYSNDLEGSRQLALMLVGSLFANQEFLNDFSEAKIELEKTKR